MDAATIQLSDLHGIWRQVYARRNALHATADDIVLAAYQDDIRTLSLVAAVRAWRHAIGETADPATVQRRTSAEAAVLAALAARPWKRTRATLVLALQQAYSAGWLAGTHIATSSHDDDTDWDDTAPDSYTIGAPKLTDAQANATAATTLSAALKAAARTAGRAIADAGSDPAAAGKDSLTAATAFSAALDLAVSAAYGAGLTAAYINTGAQALDWVTAADVWVCYVCSRLANEGPYSPFATPMLPAHPHCRCVLKPA